MPDTPAVPLDFDDALGQTQLKKGPPCAVTQILEAMPPDQAEKFARAVADPLVKATNITRALEAMGYPVHKDTVARHRRRDCKCD